MQENLRILCMKMTFWRVSEVWCSDEEEEALFPISDLFLTVLFDFECVQERESDTFCVYFQIAASRRICTKRLNEFSI